MLESDKGDKKSWSEKAGLVLWGGGGQRFK